MRRAGRQAGPAPGGAPKGTPSGTRETMHDETERAEPETAATAPTGQSDADAGTDAAEVEAEAESAAAAAAAGAASASAETEAEDSSRQEDAPDAAPDAASDDDGGDDDGGDEAASGEAALKDQLLRALADAENARRRARKDVEEARAYAISRFAEDLLSVADNLGRALESIPADRRDDDEAVKAIADGIEMTVRGFEAVMGRHGITKIDPLGEKFDYNLHQALFEIAETDQPDGTVVQVAQTGYRIGDRLLRAAMVGVAKARVEGASVPADNEEPGAVAADGADGADGAHAPADDPA